MPQMSSTATAAYLDATHAVARIKVLLDMGIGQRAIKAGPTTARLVFIVVVEQRRVAAYTVERARSRRHAIVTAKRRFCTRLARHMVLLWRELSFLFLIGFMNVVGMSLVVGHGTLLKERRAETVSRALSRCTVADNAKATEQHRWP